MDAERCVFCGEIIPEGMMVCYGCEQNGGPKQKTNTPSDFQIKLANKIAETLGIDFPWSSDEFTEQMFQEFINNNVSKVKKHVIDSSNGYSIGDMLNK